MQNASINTFETFGTGPGPKANENPQQSRELHFASRSGRFLPLAACSSAVWRRVIVSDRHGAV